RHLAARVEALARSVPGLVDVQAERLVLVPQLRLRVRPEAARFGYAPGALAEVLEKLVGGEVVGQVLEDDRSFEMLVRLDDGVRADVDALAVLPIDTPSGARV